MFLLAGIFLILVVGILSLQFPTVQTYLTKKVATYLSNELDNEITIERIYFKPFSSLELIQFCARDKNGDTIIASKELQADLMLTYIFANRLTIKEIQLKETFINYQAYKDSSNFSNIINYFVPKKDQPKTTDKRKLQLKLGRIVLDNNHFRMVKHHVKHKNKGVDFANLDITSLSGEVDNIKLDSTVSADIKDLTLREKSGLYIRKLSTTASYTARKMEFQDLFLSTNRSTLQDYLLFEYDAISDFNDFLTKVNVTSNLEDSYVDSRDIEFFAPSIEKVVFDTHIRAAKLTGTVADIDARQVELSTAKKTTLAGDFTIKGLPDINKTIFDFRLSRLETIAEDVEYLVPRFANSVSFTLPEQVHRFGHVHFNGKFHGHYNDFLVDGLFKTSLGDLTAKTDITLQKDLTYKGHVRTNRFELGRFMNLSSFGQTDLDVNFEGHGLALETLKLQTDGFIKNSHIKGYSYDVIEIDGHIENKLLKASGHINDENLKLAFLTAIDWKDEETTYQLETSIDHAALNPLKWVQRDSVTIHSARINTNIQGQSINTTVGYLHADSIAFSTTYGDFHINTLQFDAEGDQQNRVLRLNSDVVDAKMHGNIDLNTIMPYFKALAMRYAPAIGFTAEPYNSQNFDLDVNIKSFQPIAALVDPTLSLDDGARLSASFSSDNFMANFTAYSPSVLYKGMKLVNLGIEERADNKNFQLDVTADRLNFGDSTYINKITVRNQLINDSLLFNIEMSEESASNYLNLNGDIYFAHNAPAYIRFTPSKIVINKENWLLNDDASLHISKGKIYIHDLVLSQAQQSIRLDGVMSNENDKLHVFFDKFGLASLYGITNPLGIELKGNMSGNFEITSLFKKPFASANIQTTPIIYNNIPIGQLLLKADFEPESGLANIDLNLEDNFNRGVFVTGQYNFYSEDEKLDLKGKLIETDLIIFQPFLKTLVSDLTGKAFADVHITGTFRNPKITGTGRFTNAGFTVNYLKTQYKVDNQSAEVENNAIKLTNMIIRDIKGNTASANGTINLQKLANPHIDVSVKADNFMILNTTFRDNNLFYGTAFTSGDFRFKGYTSAIDIDIDARSEPNTILTIPFNSAMTVDDSDFIYFVSKDTISNQKQERRKLFQGLTMNMDLSLNPNAEVNLQTDLGSLKGNGNGEITLKISTLGDFEMFGDYIVNSGKFHFTAQDFINKYFDLREGGTIRWTGTPSEAVINLNAVYQQRTAIEPLYNAAGRSGDNERVLAEANMLIKGTLDQPDITFDLNFPQNPYIKDQLQGFLSDANNVNQQALSLIVRRSFTPSSTTEIGREVNNTLLSAGTEIAFNQLNNIISQSLNINFFDLNIRSFNDASASVRLLNDRLILTGGITDRTNFQATDLTFFREGVTTDAELTYRLRKDGNLMLRAYNRPYTRNFLIRVNDAEYISAVGLVYRQEFNSLSEFWRRMWRLNLRPKNEEKEDQKD